MGQTLISGLANGGIYALLAVGIVLVYKGSRTLNFAQAELGTFGLYLTWWMVEDLGQPWLVGALVAIVSVGVIGLLFERFVVRRMGGVSRISVAVATIGLLLFLIAAELKIWGPSPQTLDPPIAGMGPRILGYFVSPTQMLALAAALGVGIALALFLRRTDFGLGVLAASEDQDATRLVGVPLGRVSAFTWVTAGIVSVIAALLIAPQIGLFAPGFMVGLFVRGLAAALIGGLTSLPGAFLGGLMVGEIEAVVGRVFVQSTFPGLPTMSVTAVILLFLLVRPQGVLGRSAA